MATSTSSICSIPPIYNKTFSYCVPRAVVENMLNGTFFDNTTAYTPEERERLTQDINGIWQETIATNPIKEPLAVITAGAPGAGKTVLLNQLLEEQRKQGKSHAYTDPDDVCLRNMHLTHGRDVKETSTKEQRLTAYNKWRPGSNAAAHLTLANLIKQKYAFYFGTTSSSPLTAKTFSYLKGLGYRIHLIHISAPDAVRWGSIQERDGTFVQTTEKDVHEKGNLVPQRINDTYRAFADQIDFYYRDKAKGAAILTATWLKQGDQLRIHNPTAYTKMVNLHNRKCKEINKPELYWEECFPKLTKSLS